MRNRARFKWDYNSDLVLKDILGQTDRGAQNKLSAIYRCEIKIDKIYTLTWHYDQVNYWYLFSTKGLYYFAVILQLRMRVKSPNKFCLALPSFRFFVFRLKVSSRVFVRSLLTHTLEMVDCIAWFSHIIKWNFIVFVKINWAIFVSPMLSTQGNLKQSSESQRMTL